MTAIISRWCISATGPRLTTNGKMHRSLAKEAREGMLWNSSIPSLPAQALLDSNQGRFRFVQLEFLLGVFPRSVLNNGTQTLAIRMRIFPKQFVWCIWFDEFTGGSVYSAGGGLGDYSFLVSIDHSLPFRLAYEYFGTYTQWFLQVLRW